MLCVMANPQTLTDRQQESAHKVFLQLLNSVIDYPLPEEQPICLHINYPLPEEQPVRLHIDYPLPEEQPVCLHHF